MQLNRYDIPDKKRSISIPTASGTREKAIDRQLGLLSMQVKNNLQFFITIMGMAGMMAYIGYTISGLFGVLIAFIASGLGFVLTSNFSIERALRRKNVRFIHPHEGGVLYDMVSNLASKARLDNVPFLFVDDSSGINAYTVEDKERSVIVISRGIISNLTKRELYGVLAHEIAHLKNNDVRIMLFSDQLRKLTGYMALFGQFLLILNLPFLLLNEIVIPWTTIILLITAPMLSLLFQVAISRNREFKADMDAALLAGDASGLISALNKISIQTRFWEKLYAPYIKNVPEILRTHPHTGSRIKRLSEMVDNRKKELGWSQLF